MSCRSEKRVPNTKLPSTAASTSEALSLVASRLGVGVVEIIDRTSEGICAGEIAGQPLLLHVKAFPGKMAVALTARTTDAALADAVAVFATNGLGYT